MAESIAEADALQNGLETGLDLKSNGAGDAARAPAAAAPSAEDAQPSGGGAWKPRWRSNPDAVPTAYSEPKKGPMLLQGQYRTSDIGEFYGGTSNHSFVTLGRHLDAGRASTGTAAGPTPGSTSTDATKQLSERNASNADEPVETIACIVYHRGANPVPAQAGTYEIHTRNHIGSILAHHAGDNTPLPLFKQLNLPYAAYNYNGMYEIAATEILPGGSAAVREFVMRRDESQRNKSAAVWKDKLSSDWLRVEVRRCEESKQAKDPLAGLRPR